MKCYTEELIPLINSPRIMGFKITIHEINISIYTRVRAKYNFKIFTLKIFIR